MSNQAETDLIIEFLSEELEIEATFVSETKGKDEEETEVRLFFNRDTQEQFYFVGPAEQECHPFPAGPVLFSIYENEGFDPEYGTQFNVNFNPKKYWDEEKCLYDQHLEYTLDAVMGLPEFIEGEDMENFFSVANGTDRATIMSGLTALGYVHSPEQEAFVNRIGA